MSKTDDRLWAVFHPQRWTGKESVPDGDPTTFDATDAFLDCSLADVKEMAKGSGFRAEAAVTRLSYGTPHYKASSGSNRTDIDVAAWLKHHGFDGESLTEADLQALRTKVRGNPYPRIDPENMMFCRIPIKCRDLVIRTLLEAGFVDAADGLRDFTSDYVNPAQNDYRLKMMDRALASVDQEKVNIDDDSALSPNDTGAWVLAWVYVDYPERADEDEEDDE